MPEISRFYGIIIRMFYNEHNPPHFHAAYGDDEIVIAIETLSIIGGKIPPRALGLVMEWAAVHQNSLLEDWNKARTKKLPEKIPPLK